MATRYVDVRALLYASRHRRPADLVLGRPGPTAPPGSGSPTEPIPTLISRPTYRTPEGTFTTWRKAHRS